jgi:ATP-dependent Clp protease adaptor protein ClpS
MPHDEDHAAHVQREGGLALEKEPETKQPQRYKVLVHNDDYTTMEFVVMVLEVVFHRPDTEAVRIMLHVHQQGVGVAGVYSFEEAETRIAKVARLAREHEFPLKCSMEPE